MKTLLRIRRIKSFLILTLFFTSALSAQSEPKLLSDENHTQVLQQSLDFDELTLNLSKNIYDYYNDMSFQVAEIIVNLQKSGIEGTIINLTSSHK